MVAIARAAQDKTEAVVDEGEGATHKGSTFEFVALVVGFGAFDLVLAYNLIFEFARIAARIDSLAMWM